MTKSGNSKCVLTRARGHLAIPTTDFCSAAAAGVRESSRRASAQNILMMWFRSVIGTEKKSRKKRCPACIKQRAREIYNHDNWAK
jgi:hypothetical protein